jgi:anti-sigma factor RsiW
MTCDDSRIYLPAYLDEELDVSDSLRVQKHLGGCQYCRQAQEQQLVLRSALRDPDLRAYPSDDFVKRIEAAVHRAAKEESRARRSSRFDFLRFESFHWVPATTVLLLMAAVGAFLVTNSLRSSHQQLIAGAVLAGHIRSLQPNHLIDVPSSDRHTVKPWFQGRLDFSPPVPDLSELGWTLLGGRLDYVDGRPVAVIVYQRRMHNINVFLWPNHGSTDDVIRQQEAQGYQILHWNGAAMTYWVVSDLNNAELLEFARALRGH